MIHSDEERCLPDIAGLHISVRLGVVVSEVTDVVDEDFNLFV